MRKIGPRRVRPGSAGGSVVRPAVVLLLMLGFSAGAGRAGDLTRQFSDIDDISLEALLSDPVVETMTLRAQRSGEVPGTVIAFTGGELRKLGILTVQDAILYVLGASVGSGPDGAVYSFRGVSDWLNNKILFLIDGVPMNDPVTGGFTTQFGFPIEEIRQMEVVLGPGSALYGANAYSGVINILTWRGNEHCGLEVSGGVGSEPLQSGMSRRMGYVGYSSGAGPTQFRLSGYLSGAGGTDPTNHSGNPYALELPPGGNAETDVAHLRGRMEHRRTALSLDLHRFESGAPGLSFFPTPRDQRWGGTTMSSIEQVFHAGPMTRFLLRGTYQHYRYHADLYAPAEQIADQDFLTSGQAPILIDSRDGITLYVFSPLDGLFHETDLEGNPIPGGKTLDVEGAAYLVPLEGATEQTSSDNPFDRGLLQFQYQRTIGGSGSLVGAVEAQWTYGSPAIAGQSIRTRNLAAYGQWDQAIGDWNFLLGGRVDDHSEYGTFTSPRTSIVWRPRPGTVGKISFSRAFRAPTVVELHGDVDFYTVHFQGNPDLGPESITAWETSIGQAFSARVRARITGFHYRLHDVISTVGIDGDRYYFLSQIPGKDVGGLVLTNTAVDATYVNHGGRNHRTGLELEIESALGRGFKGVLGFCWTEVERQELDSGNVTPANHLLHTTGLLGRLEGPAPGGGFHIRLLIPSRAPSELEQEAATDGGLSVETEQFYENLDQTDLAIGYQLRLGGLTVSFLGENLLGSDGYVANIPGFGTQGDLGPSGYRIDHEPYWFIKVGWHE